MLKQISITLHCHSCQSAKIKKNGKKSDGNQNYLCKYCKRQFTGDHAIRYRGCHSGIIRRILLIPVRGVGIRDVSDIEQISIKKVLSVLVRSVYVLHPKQSHSQTLEVDGFWTYIKKKSGKVWLIYAYDRESGEIVAYVLGYRNLKTARKLRKYYLNMASLILKFARITGKSSSPLLKRIIMKPEKIKRLA